MAKGTVNKVIILGRLGMDPDVRATATGAQVVNLNIATSELGPKDQNGQRESQTEWHRCVLFGRTAEVAAQYLQKGSLVYLEGRLQTRKWQDQNGVEKYTTEVVCFEMQLVGGRNDGQQQGGQNFQSMPQNNQAVQQAPPNQQAPQNQQAYQQAPQNNQAMQQAAQQSQRRGPPANFQPQIGVNPNQQQAQPGPSAFDDFDDDIPF